MCSSVDAHCVLEEHSVLIFGLTVSQIWKVAGNIYKMKERKQGHGGNMFLCNVPTKVDDVTSQRTIVFLLTITRTSNCITVFAF